MAIRTAMTNIVAYLRQHGNAAEDEVFNGVTYWTDEQLEAIADSHRYPFTVEYALLHADMNIYVPVGLARPYWLDTDTIVIDSESYTYTERTREIVTTDEIESITGIYVNMNEALADLWQQKAQQREHMVSFKAGVNQFSANQTREYCQKMAMIYRNRRIRRFKR